MRFVFAFLSFLLFGNVSAEELKHYVEIKSPQPIENPGKIEVIEFFWYGCPHCYDLELQLNEWVKNLPADIEFKRIPANLGETWGLHAKVFYTAQVLGVLERVHGDLYSTLHANPRSLKSEAEIEDFFVKHGVERQSFKNAWGSFSVDAQVRKSAAAPERYSITGVPTLIVNGRYMVTGKTAGVQENMTHIVDKLTDTIRKGK